MLKEIQNKFKEINIFFLETLKTIVKPKCGKV